jgi:hypothetical protein
MGIGCAVPWHDQATFRRALCETSNDALDVGCVIFDRSEHRLDADRWRRDLGSPHIEIVIGSGLGIEHKSRACKLRLDLLKHLQPFACDAWLVLGQARQITAWMGQAADESLAHGVSNPNEYDWNRAGLLLKCGSGRSRQC